jgi:predicted HAD superfamily Cof-like phosphohydrolase
MQMMTRIIEMHKKFDLAADQAPKALPDDEKNFRIVAMQEELDEYADANTRADELDALVDLQVFLLGTVYRHGFADVFDEAFNRVMDANMQKMLAGEALHSKRGFARDLVKPAGWTAPNLSDLTGDHHE